ncbi:unnamed protein product [Ectocarpus sp. 4 AP-2014]
MSETLIPLEFVHHRLLMDVAFEEVPETGNTGVHVAAYGGRLKCLGYLLSRGGDIRKKNHRGQTPAMLAALAGRTDVLEWLLENAKGIGEAPANFISDELLDIVEEMDESATYGSPMYSLLEDALNAVEAQSDGSESFGSYAREERGAQDEARDVAQAPTAERPATGEFTRNEVNGGGTDDTLDFDTAWELYAGGNIGAHDVLAVLTRIHGEGLDASWSRVLAALPSDDPYVIENLEAAKSRVDRAKAGALAMAKEDAKENSAAVAAASGDSATGERGILSPGGHRDGDEENFLRATTVKYLRGSITAEQFYDEIVDGMEERKGGAKRIEEFVIARVARGMPEEKAWPLMEAHRKRRHEERLDKKRLRRSRRRRAEAASKGNATKSTARAEPPRQGDDSSVASVFSLGGSVDSCDISTSAKTRPDLDQAVTKYRENRISAAEMKTVLSDAFGNQVGNILPRVLATLSNRKRRELISQWHVDSDRATKLRRPRILQPRASFVSTDIVPVKDQNIIRMKTPGGSGASEAVTGAEDSPDFARQGGLDRAERASGKKARDQPHGRLVEGAGVTHGGGRKGGREQVRQRSRTSMDQRDHSDDDDELGPIFSKPNSPFTTRASTWAGGATGNIHGEEEVKPTNKAPRDGRKGERRPTEVTPAPGDAVQGSAARARAAAPSVGKNGDDDGRNERDKDKAQTVFQKRKLRDSMEMDAQRLTSEFAAGRLAAPHFFGAMMEEFGEKRLLAALPGILRVLPEGKAAELQAFASEAEGEAGVRTKARQRERELLEKATLDKEQQEQQEEKDEREVEQEPTVKAGAEGAASKESKNSAPRNSAGKERADSTGHDNPVEAATHEGADGAKNRKLMKKKGGERKADAAEAAAAATRAPEEQKGERKKTKGKKMKEKKGKEKKGEQVKERAAAESAAAANEGEDVDVEGGGLFEMSRVERDRYNRGFSKLSPDGAPISPTKAASTLSKSGLPRESLRRIWVMADVEKDDRLNREEWAVAMHLVMCSTAKQMPLPGKLPKCLRTPPIGRQHQPLPEEDQPGGGRNAKNIPERKPKKNLSTPTSKRKYSPPTDFKQATKEFKNGDMEAENYLPILRAAFGKKELAKMWPKLLPRLPPEKARELAEAAGLDFEALSESVTSPVPRQARTGMDATASYKRGDMGAREYFENVLQEAFGDKLAGMLPDILKALPPDRAEALAAVAKAQADDVRRLAEDTPHEWAMSLDDRRVYDKAFVKLDKDRDGFLSSAEARPVLKKAVGICLGEAQLGDLWKMADIDRDGRLTREEWAIAYHLMRCVVKREMKLPATLPEVLATTAGERLPSL